MIKSRFSTEKLETEILMAMMNERCRNLIARQRTCWCVQRRYAIAHHSCDPARWRRARMLWTGEGAAIYNSFKAKQERGRAQIATGENTTLALICRSTHRQLLGKLCDYAAARVVFLDTLESVFPYWAMRYRRARL